MSIFLLRSETKKNEFRRALTPNDCQEIIAAGHKVIVEDWSDSIIPIDDYKAVGCEISESGSWVNSPIDTIIVGLKALPENIDTFVHTHIYFAHAFKEQDGWRELLGKFKAGGGRIIDLEFMLADNGRRVCAFGYWAGYVGAGLGALFSASADRERSIATLKKLRKFPDKQDLINFIKIETQEYQGEAIVIGCKGRSGSGAMDLFTDINWKSTGWDKVDTDRGGPFSEILSYELFVNCVLAMEPMPPFLTTEMLPLDKKLNMISDVSCDPDSDKNMIPIYSEATIIDDPLLKINEINGDIDLVAIDNLPSILPKEASFDFSSQLSPFIENFDEKSGPVEVALDIFNKYRSKV